MKTYLLIGVVSLSLAGASCSCAGQEAQLVVTVPFDFIVGTQTLPAGNYTIRGISSVTNSPLLISNHDHGFFLFPTLFDGAQFGNTGPQF